MRVLEVDVDRAGARARRHLRHDRVGYLFQRPSDNLFPHLTLAEHLRLARAGRRADADDAREVVGTLGLEHRLDHRPGELSGGEQQRAAVALALLSGASVILADEPTAQLDRTSGEELMSAVHALAGRGVAFVVATHDPQVRSAADDIVMLDHGSASRPARPTPPAHRSCRRRSRRANRFYPATASRSPIAAATRSCTRSGT